MSPNNTIKLLLLLLSNLPTNTRTQESNNNFCGTTWDDASSNCAERQHCPTGTDSECEISGHICFGGTTCDVTKGDGAKFKFANVPYNDISNTRFCGGNWDEAFRGCSVESHCPSVSWMLLSLCVWHLAHSIMWSAWFMIAHWIHSIRAFKHLIDCILIHYFSSLSRNTKKGLQRRMSRWSIMLRRVGVQCQGFDRGGRRKGGRGCGCGECGYSSENSAEWF